MSFREKLAGLKQRMGIVGEFFGFLWERKLWWMLPIFALLLIVGSFILVAQSSSLSPFLYTLI